MSAALLVLGLVLVALGVALLALPAAPAIVIIFAGVASVAWSDGFARISVVTLGILLLLTIVGSLADNVATLFGARQAGASGWGVAGAAVGMLLGLAFGLPGIVVGPALGAFLFELFRHPDVKRAGMAGLGGLFGFLLGIVAKSFFGMLIVGIAALAYLF
ncbi:MAG: DUF456 family protein [Vicinamibacterales bacterium]